VAVKIKLKRLGRTRVPTYRIVVADARTKRDGRAIEEIGKYHPKEEPSLIEVDSERAQHWLSVGAQPTAPVMNILRITGDWQKFRGEAGSEGTLRTAEAAADKKEIFAAALKEAAKDDTASSGSSGAKGGGRARKPDTAKADKDTAKAEKADTKADKDTAKAEKAEKADAGKAGSGRGKARTGGQPAAGSADEAAGSAASSEAAAADAKAAAAAAEPEGSEPGSGA
jgi:small subunit ribosomal protein S16